jgi:hypothetical protein
VVYHRADVTRPRAVIGRLDGHSTTGWIGSEVLKSRGVDFKQVIATYYDASAALAAAVPSG